MVRLAVIAIGLSVVFAGAVSAGQPTRDDFIAGADAICRADLRKSNPIARKGLKQLDDQKFAKGARKLRRALRILRGIREVADVPHPPEDDAAIDAWIAGELKALRLADRGWKAVGERRFAVADRKFKKSDRVHRRSHRPVSDFDFKYCA